MDPPTHVLGLVTNEHGDRVTMHLDLAGVDLLIAKLQALREQLRQGECPHLHLHAWGVPGDELTPTQLQDQPNEATSVTHLKIYGWNAEWLDRHRLR